MVRFRSWIAVACFVLGALPHAASAYLRVQDLAEGTDAAFPDVTAGNTARPTLAPDGRTLYIAGGSDDSLMAMTRDPVTGHVGDVVDVERDGANGVDGLRGARDALVSPDNRFVYVAGGDEAAVAVFERTAAPDLLTHVETQISGIAGVQDILGPVAPLFSPGATHLYVPARLSNTIAVFAREADGTLEFLESEDLGVNSQPVSAATSPDGRFVYAAEPSLDRIAIVARDVATGLLTLADHFEDGEQGASLVGIAKVVTTDARFLYALVDGSVLQFERDAATGALTYLGEQGLNVGITDVEFASFGRVVAAGCCAISPNDVLSVYARDAATGAVLVPAVDGATLQRFDATHRTASAREHIYVLESEPGEAPLLEVFSEPLLDRLESQQDGFASANALDGADAVAPSPDGRHVYVASSFDGAVQIFARDAVTGEIDAIGEAREGVACTACLAGATAVALSRDGSNLYVASSTHDAISVFARNAQSGALVWFETVSDAASVCPLDGPSSIAVTDDGREVFTTASISDSLCRFDRDAVTGALTFAGFAAGAAQNLLGADDVTLSPDGRNVYVAAVGSDAIAQYSRDPVTGDLAPLGAVTDDDGLDSLASAAGIVVSRDGRFAYAVSFASDAIAVLSRDVATGALTLIDEVVSDASSLTILGPRALKLAHGSLLIASESGVVVLRRDPADGHLGYAQRAISNAGSYAAYDVAVSPDGRSSYATAFGDDRVEVYAPEPDAALLAVAVLLALAGVRSRVRLRSC
jgi:6-phosphogluconolactonase (cycloisomerase 2 family)